MNSLNSELVLSDRHTVDKLNRTPQPMQLSTLINIHDSVSRCSAMPHWVLDK